METTPQTNTAETNHHSEQQLFKKLTGLAPNHVKAFVPADADISNPEHRRLVLESKSV